MPLQIQDTTYFTGSEIAEEAGVTRQSLWRWLKTGKVPAGYKHRSGQVVFTAQERDAILRFANQVEPLASEEEEGESQLGLFNGS